MLADVRQRIRKVRDGRLGVPQKPPLYGAAQHLGCQWPRDVCNHPGRRFGAAFSSPSATSCRNGSVVRDIHGRTFRIEKFKNIVNVENTWPLTFVDQWSLTEVTAELATSCYAARCFFRPWDWGDGCSMGSIPSAFSAPVARPRCRESDFVSTPTIDGPTQIPPGSRE